MHGGVTGKAREGLPMSIWDLGLRISDCEIIVLRFVPCQWSVVRRSKNKGQREKSNIFYSMLHVPSTKVGLGVLEQWSIGVTRLQIWECGL